MLDTRQHPSHRQDFSSFFRATAGQDEHLRTDRPGSRGPGIRSRPNLTAGPCRGTVSEPAGSDSPARAGRRRSTLRNKRNTYVDLPASPKGGGLLSAPGRQPQIAAACSLATIRGSTPLPAASYSASPGRRSAGSQAGPIKSLQPARRRQRRDGCAGVLQGLDEDSESFVVSDIIISILGCGRRWPAPAPA
jgi:hypothetical protein